MFFFPLFHEDLFSLELPCATRLLETSCLEKITEWAIETMFIIFVKKRHPRCSKYILTIEYCSEYVSGSVNYFRKELHLRCLTGFWIRLWHKVVFSFGRNSESNYIECRVRGVLEKSSLGKLILSQNILEISYCNKDK